MNEELARAVLAGYLIGFATAIAFTAALAIMLVQLRSRYVFLERAIAANLTPLHVAVPLSLVTFLAWTAIGMLCGLFFDGLEEAVPTGALGSPNVTYTIVVVSLGYMAVGPLIWLVPPFRRHLIAAFLAYAGLFGWGLPHLAT